MENKVALYCRVDSSSSPESLKLAACLQKTKLERYTKKRNLPVVACYEDIGYSGNDFLRPGFNTMLSDYAKGRFDTVLVVNRSRLSRGNLENKTMYPFKIISLDALNRHSEL